MSDDETRVFSAPQAELDPNALVGKVLAGRYRILELLGVGAMGAVYLGQHMKIGRKDAIKVLHSAMARDPDAIARFDRGARNVGAIRHPNVCTIYDFSDTDDGLQYLAMEFVPGETLKDTLDREGTLGLERSVRIAELAASALHAAHKADIVHRDLKPANIMIATGHDGEDLVKVVDFDISKGSSEGIEAEVTRLGYVVGTPEYMSPEQLWGGALDGRSDVYSLALVLCRMLTGKLPFRGDNLQEIMSARLSDTPLLRLEELAPGKTFPPGLQDTIDRALHRRAADRTASAAEFATQLKASGADPSTRVLPAALPETQVVSSVGVSTTGPATMHTPAAASPSATIAVAAGKPKRNMAAYALGGLVVVAGIGIAISQSGVLSGPPATDPQTQASDSLSAPTDQLAGGTTPPANSGDAGTNGGAQNPAGPDRNVTEKVGANDPEPAPGTITPPSASTPDLATQAPALLNAYRDKLLDPASLSSLSPAAMRGMRDTAQAIYALPVSVADRAKAAHIAASMLQILREPCTEWAQRAVNLVPTSRAYAGTLTFCKGPGQ